MATSHVESGTLIRARKKIQESHAYGHAHYAGISLGIIGGSLEKRIIGTDLSDDVKPVHMTILLQRSLRASAMQSASGWRHETSYNRNATWRRHGQANVQQ